MAAYIWKLRTPEDTLKTPVSKRTLQEVSLSPRGLNAGFSSSYQVQVHISHNGFIKHTAKMPIPESRCTLLDKLKTM